MTLRFEVVKSGDKHLFHNGDHHEPLEMNKPLPLKEEADVKSTISFLDAMFR